MFFPSFSLGLFGLASYSFSLWTLCNLAMFLSSQSPPQPSQASVFECCLIDCGLLILFVVQHSTMNRESVKSLYKKYGIEHLERTVYVIFTNICVLLLITFWKPIEGLDLWTVDTQVNLVVWWSVSLAHVLMWYLIYNAAVLLDMPDLLGVKQLTIHLYQEEDRMSSSLRRLYGHMRHPSFLALTLIFFIRPTMSLDRFLLGLGFSSYMYLAWRPDLQDHTYQCNMWRNKKQILTETSAAL